MMDIVERLRDLSSRTIGILNDPLAEAADIIEQLRQQLAELKQGNFSHIQLENESLKLANSVLKEQLEATKLDAERYRWLRSVDRRDCLYLTGPEAGVWCDTEDAEGNLILLTEDDLDKAIDAAMRSQGARTSAGGSCEGL